MMNPNRPTPRHITIKMAKVKREDSKGSEKKHSVTKGVSFRLSVDFSTETLPTRREWHIFKDIFKVLKGKNLHPRELYQARFSFRIGEIKNFSDKQKLKEYSNTRPTLKEILKVLL